MRETRLVAPTDWMPLASLRARGVLWPAARAALLLVVWFVVQAVLFLPIQLLGLATTAASTLAAGAALSEVLGLNFVQAAGTALTVWLFRRFLDRQSFLSLGFFPPVARRIAVGLLIGGGLMALVVAIQAALGVAYLAGTGADRADVSWLLLWGLGSLALMAMVGFNEELLVRGYLLQNVAASFGVPAGVLITSAIFALLHLLNPGASLLAMLNIGLAGIFFALLYLASRSLWTPIAAHAAWNFVQGWVFGLPVSGTRVLATLPLLDFELRGDPRLSGGLFGPEASLVTTVVLLGAIRWLWLRLRRT